MTDYKNLSASDRLIYDDLRTFYDTDDKVLGVVTLMKSKVKNALSGRLITFILTGLRETTGIRFVDSKTGTLKDVSSMYSRELQSWRFRSGQDDCFAIFNRGPRVNWQLSSGEEVNITLGQLVCFRWLYQQGILEMIQKHLDVFVPLFSAANKSKEKRRPVDKYQCQNLCMTVSSRGGGIVEKSRTVSADRMDESGHKMDESV